MKKTLSGGVLLGLVACAVVAVVGSMKSEEVHAYPMPVGPIATEVAGFNSAGDHVYAQIVITDNGGSGVLVTPLDGGVFTNVPPSAAVADGGVSSPAAPIGQDGSGCITPDTTTGTFTVNKLCGTGTLILEGCVGEILSGNTAGVARGAWTRTRASVAAQLAPEVRKTEIVDAGAIGPMGCDTAIDTAQNGDTYNFTLATSGATALTHTVKEATFTVLKVRQ